VSLAVDYAAVQMAGQSTANMPDQFAKTLAQCKLLLRLLLWLLLLLLLLAGCFQAAVLILVMNGPVDPGTHECLQEHCWPTVAAVARASHCLAAGRAA